MEKQEEEADWKNTYYVQYEADGVLIRDERVKTLTEAEKLMTEIIDNSAYGKVKIRHRGRTIREEFLG